MSEDIQLIADDYGLTVIGESQDVEQFLSSQGFKSTGIDINGPALAGYIAAALEAGGELSQYTGHWVQLSADTAKKIEQFGLIQNNSTGLLTGTIGQGGRGGIKGIVQFVSGPTTLNPMMLTSVGTVMAQIAMQQMMAQVTTYLETIDRKIDDIIRAQHDAEISKMIGAGIVINEAMVERNHTGTVSEITWSTVQDTKQTLAAAQAYALRRMDAFVDQLEHMRDIGHQADLMKRGTSDIAEWLAVLAKCLQLQDGYSILKLDRVRGCSPEELNQHRSAELVNREHRLELASRTTARVVDRITAVSENANGQVFLHPFDSHTVIDSGNAISERIANFSEQLGLEATRQSIKAKEWVDAAAETRDWVLDKGTEGAKAIAAFGTGVINHLQPTAQHDSKSLSSNQDEIPALPVDENPADDNVQPENDDLSAATTASDTNTVLSNMGKILGHAGETIGTASKGAGETTGKAIEGLLHNVLRHNR